MNLILASESPGRKKVLENAGFVFKVEPSDFIEDMTLPMKPHELVMYLSVGKARVVAARHHDAIIIGADSVAVFEDQVLGKPHTPENNHKMLSMLSGKVHSIITGLTVINTKTQKEITQFSETKVWFRDLSNEEIKKYVDTGEALKKAGGYAYQLEGKKFVKSIEGSDTTIIGMPLELLQEILNNEI